MIDLQRIIMIGLIIAVPCFTSVSNGQAITPEEQSSANLTEGKTKNAQQQMTLPDSARVLPKSLIYKPPLRGSPTGRVGGGSRGLTERESFSLLVLAPDHVGLTIKEQPRLYWYISKPIPCAVEYTIIERNAVNPLFEKRVTLSEKSGIQSFCLSDYGVHLHQNIQYKWFVTLVTDADYRSKDILAGGIISLISPPQSLPPKMEAASGIGVAYVYAEEGLWYDALETLSVLIDASPNNTELRQERASLLEQIGLSEVADFEKRQQ